jgi:glycosyltransferase involved in cell wall biosynthesis
MAHESVRSHHGPHSSSKDGPPHVLPLVSCIMPTADRRAFVPRAVALFLRQDYPARELLILDDGADPVADLLPADPRIRYVRLERRLVLGAKRNLACELARGPIIAHWDDDDWHAPYRLSSQVTLLLQRRADICGAGRLLYYRPSSAEAWLYVYPQSLRPWVAGNSLCYRRDFWVASPFPAIAVGEDTRFVWGPRPLSLAVASDHTFLVGLIHAGNTSPKQVHGAYWRPVPVAAIAALLQEDMAWFGHPYP